MPQQANSFLVSKKNISDPEIANIIKKIVRTTQNLRLFEILVKNPYEKLAPYNLWFYHPDYHVENYCENNQNLRVRYFKSTMLTPLVSTNRNNLSPLKSFIHKMSLYQPFYPETFYIMWDFLQMKHLDQTMRHFLQIGHEDRLGSLEAIIFHHEKYQLTYQYNTYNSWLVGNEQHQLFEGHYQLAFPKISYLEQAYKVKFLESTLHLKTYHLISIDANHPLDTIGEWKKEELDLQANLFYFLTALNHLDDKGSLIIRLYLISSPAWYIIFEIAYRIFREYTFVRPAVSHPFNPEVYLCLNSFESKNKINPLYYHLLKNLYRHQTYQNFFINASMVNQENPIVKRYMEEVTNWKKGVIKTLSKNDINIPESIDCLNDWHAVNDLKQIRHLSPNFNSNHLLCQLKSAKLTPIKLILPTSLYAMPFYKKLIQKRSELNYYKRVMDTKPSQIFTSKYQNTHNDLLTWEQLTYEIDIYKDLKNILKREYQAEMVTNAWIKMYEMLHSTRDLIPLKERIKTFHLCEAPGAFIAALTHYISNRATGMLDWYAQSLKPSESEMALSDHFGLMGAYPSRWIFGDAHDNSGDITHSAVIKSYMNNPLLQNIDFMTADAGLFCNPTELNEQESHLGKINMGQIVCILACLPKGKSAILKTFLPMTEPLTISLMYLLTNLFTTVILIKPCASHSANSEIYVILKSYKGIEPSMLEILYLMLDDPKVTSKTLLFKQMDKLFFESYCAGIGQLIDRQIQSLSRHYYYYYHLDQIPQFKENIAPHIEDWLKINPVFQLKQRLIENNGYTASN